MSRMYNLHKGYIFLVKTGNLDYIWEANFLNIILKVTSTNVNR